jgi:CBS domain-containing protein
MSIRRLRGVRTSDQRRLPVSERCRRVLVGTLPSERLLDAAIRMRRCDVSALPVSRGQRLVGIVTERDVVTAVADGVDPATSSVADYMTDRPVAVGPDEDVAVAARRMTELGVRHLPVVDAGRLVGMLSMRDLQAPACVPTGRPLRAAGRPVRRQVWKQVGCGEWQRRWVDVPG